MRPLSTVMDARRFLAVSHPGSPVSDKKTTFGVAVASWDFTRVGLAERRLGADWAKEGDREMSPRRDPGPEGILSELSRHLLFCGSI